MLNRHGADQWGAATAVAVPVLVACAWLAMRGEPAWWLPFGVVAVAWLGFCAFFRDPPRHPAPDSDGCWLSPADGVVSAVEHHTDHAAVGGPAVVIRIFLSVLDVHVNRMPWDGQVTSRSHRPGQYLDARDPRGAHLNESLLLCLRSPGGVPFGIRQVSGAIARRIVCTPRPGDQVRRGDRMGLIKFGSTTELIVPQGVGGVLVRVGHRVHGGVTPLLRSLEGVA